MRESYQRLWGGDGRCEIGLEVDDESSASDVSGGVVEDEEAEAKWSPCE